MPIEFDKMAVVAAWLDALRAKDLVSLLDLYDRRGTIQCHCEPVALYNGWTELRGYWSERLADASFDVTELERIWFEGEHIGLDYRCEQSTIRIFFTFTGEGKIGHTQCGPIAACTKAA